MFGIKIECMFNPRLLLVQGVTSHLLNSLERLLAAGVARFTVSQGMVHFHGFPHECKWIES